MRRLLLFIVVIICASGVIGAGPKAKALTTVAQCRSADRVIPKQIRFGRGRTTAVIKDTVRICTSHEYTLRARAGQTMSVNLAVGKNTGMTIMPPSGEALLDGGKEWSGELPETGDYVIQIGTDVTARYTLEVTIR